MSLSNIVGITGVGLILLAYFLHSFGMLQKNKTYFLLNAAGAALACLASWMIGYYPFVILEGVWTLVSIIGYINLLKPVNSR